MPGMMDTVLNIGLNDEVVEGLARLSGNQRFAYDSYRRLINMYGDTVMGGDTIIRRPAIGWLRASLDGISEGAGLSVCGRTVG